jgi:hypothetical protein
LGYRGVFLHNRCYNSIAAFFGCFEDLGGFVGF